MRNKLNIMKARRRARLRSALLLSVLAAAVSMLFGVVVSLSPMAQGAQLALETMVTVVAFGMTAYLGLCVLDGDQRKIVQLYQLTRVQTLWLALLGVLLVAPATLISDLIDALLGAETPAAAALSSALFLPMLMKSALLVPVCEELFFRGYLLGALKRYSETGAVLLTALVFALVHGMNLSGLIARTALGLVLGLMAIRTGTLLAPVLVHGCYNAAIIVIAYCGGLASGLTFGSCALRLIGCLALLYVFRRTFTARGLKKPLEPLGWTAFTRRELALIALAAAMMILAGVTA